MRRHNLFVVIAMVICGLGIANPSRASDLSEVLFTKGVIYLDQGRYDLAVENLRGAALEDPANLEIRTCLIQAEAAAAGATSPIAYYESAVNRDAGSVDHNLHLAIALYLDGQYDQAMTSIRKAYRLSSTNGVILYYRGLIQIKTGEFREAVDDIQQARNLEPQLGQPAMFTEAYGLYKLRERKAARDLFQEVIQTNPATDYAGRAFAFLQSMAVKRFHARLSTGVAYDTNVTLVGDENTLDVPLDLPSKYQFRFPLSALVDYRFLESGLWSFGARYGFYASFHSKSNDMNVLSNQPELYAEFRSSRWYFRPYYIFESVILDYEQYADTHALGGSLMYFTPYHLAPELFFQWQNRNYLFPTTWDSDPDSNNFRGEFNQYLFFKQGGHVRAGIGFEGNLADGRNQDYNAFLVLAGLEYPLPWSTIFDFDFQYQNRDYEHTHTVFDVKREDVRYAFAWQLRKAIGRGFELAGRISYFRDDSNIPDFDYDRQVYSLLLLWSY